MILVAIGSNLQSKEYGSPYDNCLEVIKLIKKKFYVKQVSRFYKTEPIPKSTQPWFVNAVIEIITKNEPFVILEELLKLEKYFKRQRKKKNEPRIIDLDLLTYNDLILNTDSLVLPHPRMHLRKFVIKPICDLDPFWKHPLLEKSAKDILKKLANQKIFNINQARV
ncbi:MAG: 2-amino-4-hydroxy-6-hydroxymethyldihydropteridine diphosphokinase [Rickettsiales bacterium]|nr:2-amino-4-hydroxy-6-hydroxymethyldihydropteridine diphosphokinase [Rickettsiales bacterium]|tara:strand:- start:682 stop:1179 length:498 start_codon:yes stop_codon:yes gene_type:complete